jgi:hypothetical protein
MAVSAVAMVIAVNMLALRGNWRTQQAVHRRSVTDPATPRATPSLPTRQLPGSPENPTNTGFNSRQPHAIEGGKIGRHLVNVGCCLTAKAKARGYRGTHTLKAVTYLIAGKLDLKLPT